MVGCVCVSVCVCVCVLSLKALGADHGRHERAEVQDQADPAGRHLDPEHRPAAFQQLLDLMVVVATVRQQTNKTNTEKQCNCATRHSSQEFEVSKKKNRNKSILLQLLKVLVNQFSLYSPSSQ